VARLKPLRVKQASIPARQRMDQSAPARPLILTFSPAVKSSPGERERVGVTNLRIGVKFTAIKLFGAFRKELEPHGIIAVLK
jgi:hypothetical protein